MTETTTDLRSELARLRAENRALRESADRLKATLRDVQEQSVRIGRFLKRCVEFTSEEKRAIESALFIIAGAETSRRVGELAESWIGNRTVWPTFTDTETGDAEPPGVDADGWPNSE